MMAATQPANIAGSVIIVMMGFGLLSALLAWLRCQDAEALEGVNVQVGGVAPEIFPAPALLTVQGFGHVTPPLIRPAIPASDNSCLN